MPPQDAGSAREFATRLTAIYNLLSGVAHEVKNPLNAIRLQAELLHQQCGPEHESNLSVLIAEVHRLDRVLRPLLAFTRPLDLHLADFDLNELASELGSAVAAETERCGIRCQYQPAARPALVRADLALVREAALHIVVNALQAMPDGGTLTLQVDPGGDGHVLGIADTGVGIPDEHLEQMYRLYFTTKPMAAGMGLAIASRAIQLHGGAIECKSCVGQGTTFRLKLPAAAV